MPLARVGAKIATTLRTGTRRERARPISAHAHWPSRQDNAVCMHAPRVCTLVLFIIIVQIVSEMLPFSAVGGSKDDGELFLPVGTFSQMVFFFFFFL